MRYCLISIIVHILILNFVWVGFSISLLKKNSVFIYLGETIAPAQQIPESPTTPKINYNLNTSQMNEESSAFFGPWLKMRQVNKPHQESH